MTLPIYPFPRHIIEAAGAPPAPDAEVVVTCDSSLPPQGYRLDYSETIQLAYADAVGLRYAQQTLDQLRGLSTEEQRAVNIEDWPDFVNRGFMLDISRDRVPNRTTLVRLVGILSLARYTQLELYTEHTFAYNDHSEVWQDASPLTGEDLRWLDDLCAAKGIELVPNQNTFGHWERWLAHEKYLPRAENPEPQTFANFQRPPSTLAPTPDNAKFVNGLIKELSSNLRSHRVNIGADETWELGTGTSKERAATEGLGNVFLDYVEQVAQPWIDKGYTVEFWADILGSYPELMDRLPEGATPVVWLYDSPEHIDTVIERMSESERAFSAAHGVDIEQLRNFEARSKTLIDAGVPFWVAPGTGTWLSFIGRLDNAVGNILDATKTGTEHGSEGFLLTCWGDHGHYDPLVISYAPILFGGGLSWSREANLGLNDHLARILTQHVFDDATGILGRVLTEIGRVADRLDAKVGNSSPLFRAVQNAGVMEPQHVPSPDHLAAARHTLNAALLDLEDARPASPEGPTAIAEIEQSIRWALFGLSILETRVLAPGTSVDARVARTLLERLDSLLAQQRNVWLLSSRPGGLETSIGRFSAIRRALAIRAGEMLS